MHSSSREPVRCRQQRIELNAERKHSCLRTDHYHRIKNKEEEGDCVHVEDFSKEKL